MPNVNRFRDQPSLMRAVVIVAVFLAAVSAHMERLRGWTFLIVCFVAGSIGGLGVIWARNRFLLRWNPLRKSTKRIVLAAVIGIYLIATFVANHHKPDGDVDDLLACLSIIGILLLWGLYRITSRILDALHARFSRR